MKTCFLKNKTKANERLCLTCMQLLHDFFPSICFRKAFFQHLIKKKDTKKHYFLGNLHELRDTVLSRVCVCICVYNQWFKSHVQSGQVVSATYHSYKLYVCRTPSKAGSQFLNTTKYQQVIFQNITKEQ